MNNVDRAAYLTDCVLDMLKRLQLIRVTYQNIISQNGMSDDAFKYMNRQYNRPEFRKFRDQIRGTSHDSQERSNQPNIR